ncbi:hypothetical protein EYF80_049682 [Liparis tanakae]|uniref:Uncharacterized protein n=1 Tax=Liparis tanakae TaxID=230148 RepID=A0A4Z2FG29_9TELE|nr:hypothetical protein EYF80_049682 [Liparis tanakae]
MKSVSCSRLLLSTAALLLPGGHADGAAQGSEERAQADEVAVLSAPLRPRDVVSERPRVGHRGRLRKVDHPHAGLAAVVVDKEKRAADHLIGTDQDVQLSPGGEEERLRDLSWSPNLPEVPLDTSVLHLITEKQRHRHGTWENLWEKETSLSKLPDAHLAVHDDGFPQAAQQVLQADVAVVPLGDQAVVSRDKGSQRVSHQAGQTRCLDFTVQLQHLAVLTQLEGAWQQGGGQECRDGREVNVVDVSAVGIAAAESVLEERALMSSQLDPGALPPHGPVHHGQTSSLSAEEKLTEEEEEEEDCRSLERMGCGVVEEIFLIPVSSSATSTPPSGFSPLSSFSISAAATGALFLSSSSSSFMSISKLEFPPLGCFLSLLGGSPRSLSLPLSPPLLFPLHLALSHPSAASSWLPQSLSFLLFFHLAFTSSLAHFPFNSKSSFLSATSFVSSLGTLLDCELSSWSPSSPSPSPPMH